MNKLMMRLIRVGLLAVPAMLLGSVAYAAPNEGVCDDLKGFPNGLHGLCQAFCEAQDCVATIDLKTGELSFPKNCKPSSEKTLDRYKKRSEEIGGPPMPCVNQAPGGCPCWSEDEIDLVGDGFTQACQNPASYTLLVGLDAATNGQDFAVTVIDGSTLQCFYREQSPTQINIFQTIDEVQHGACDASIITECTIDREIPMTLESSILFQSAAGTSEPTATPTAAPTATPTPAPTATPTAAPICQERMGPCTSNADCCAGECYKKKCRDW